MARQFKPVRFFVVMGAATFVVSGVTAFYTHRAAHGRTAEERAAMSGAKSVEGRHATHDERRRSHHHKKTHRFKLSGHNWTPDLIPARLGRNRTYGRQN